MRTVARVDPRWSSLNTDERSKEEDGREWKNYIYKKPLIE